jgi:hypothetical protein
MCIAIAFPFFMFASALVFNLTRMPLGHGNPMNFAVSRISSAPKQLDTDSAFHEKIKQTCKQQKKKISYTCQNVTIFKDFCDSNDYFVFKVY